MFCSNCGTQLPDGLKFCTICGAPLNAPQPDSQPQQQFQTQPEPQQQFQQQQQQFQPQPAPVKKKRKKWPIAAAIVAVVAIVGTTLAVNASSVNHFFRKTFSKPESYYAYVEGKSVKGSIADVVDAFKDAKSSSANTSTKLNMTLNLESGGRAFLASVIGDMDDLSWLESIGITADVAAKDSKVSEKMIFDLNGSNLFSMDYLMDTENLIYFFRIPELCESYLTMDMMSALMYNSYALKDFDVLDTGSSFSPSDFSTLMNGLSSALPDAEKTEKFLNRYIDIFLDNLGEVTKKNSNLEIEGISEKCTVLTVNLTEKDCLRIAKAFLTEARKDAYLKDLINDLSDVIAPMLSSEYFEADDVYGQFTSVIDMALEELKDVEVSDEGNSFHMDVYVNGSGEIIGRSLSFSVYGETQELFSYGTATNGNKTAFKAEIPQADCQLIGKGTTSHSIFNGEYELIIRGLSIANMDVVDFNTEELKNGILNGTVKLSSSQLAGFSLDLDFSSKKSANSMTATVMSGSSPLFSLAIQTEPSDYSFSEIPETDDCYDITNQNDLMEYVQNINWDSLIGILKDSDIPSTYTDVIESSINQMLYYLD